MADEWLTVADFLANTTPKGMAPHLSPDRLLPLVEGPDEVGWYVYGRMNRAAFARAANAREAASLRSGDRCVSDRRHAEPEMVRCKWVRMVPLDNGRREVVAADPGEDDAVCITYVDFVETANTRVRHFIRHGMERGMVHGRDQALAWAAERLRQLGHPQAAARLIAEAKHAAR